ncbi:GNAT family N-acetyltransferase [Bacillus sp. 37MA]|uniref:GNAT family N-acetyltransferase n=1 Tax=Bacillus sp. 37MA TaxID=1132442 RepID=UPI00037356D2|nr:GNAT family N-acetyltransferase [Bacillus sp. 37MA]
MNILLTSVGRRSYLVNYFKEVLGETGSVHVANSSNLTPAFVVANHSVVTPLIYDDNYISFLLKYCKDNQIDALIPLFDVDLPVLAKNRSAFEEVGTKLIVSSETVINICNDKMATFKFLKENGFNTPKTFSTYEEVLQAIDREEINYPLIIKPRWGMGSIGIYEAENEEELGIFLKKAKREILKSYLKYESEVNIQESILIQEKLEGQEYGLDVINDLNSEYMNTIVKKKFAMRSGETDCAEVLDDSILKKLGSEISRKLKHIVNLDVDVFLVDGFPYILEMNARFGGGYPFSHQADVNLPLAITEWLKGEEVDRAVLTEQANIISHKDINMVKLPIYRKESNAKIKKIKSNDEIIQVLNSFDNVFKPTISSRIPELNQYSKKLLEHGEVYTINDEKNQIQGFAAFYANDHESKVAYLIFIAVNPNVQNKYYGKELLDLCINVSKDKGMEFLKLEVQKENHRAISFYNRNGFSYIGNASSHANYMQRELI